MVNKSAKEAVGWKKVKIKNEKSVEINNNHISTSSNLLFLKMAVKVTIAKIWYVE